MRSLLNSLYTTLSQLVIVLQIGAGVSLGRGEWILAIGLTLILLCTVKLHRILMTIDPGEEA